MHSYFSLTGNIVETPTLRKDINENFFTYVKLAVTEYRNNKEYVSYPAVRVMGGQAEALCKYKEKGAPILVEGRIRTYSDENNYTQVSLDAEQVIYLPHRNRKKGKDEEDTEDKKTFWTKQAE